MVSWRNLKIKMKLFIMFGIVFIFFAIGFMFVFLQINAIQNNLSAFTDRSEANLLTAEIGGLINEKYIHVVRFERNRVLDSQNYEANNVRIEENLSLIKEAITTEQQQQVLERLELEYGEFSTLVETFLSAPAPRTSEESIARIRDTNNLDRLRYSIHREIAELTNITSQQLVEAEQQAAMAVSRALMILAIALGAAVVSGMILIILFSNSLSKTIGRLGAITESISQGNLNINKIENPSKDEIGQLGTAINQMAEKLRSLVTGISTTSEQVASASEQMAASSKEAGEASVQIFASTQQVASGAEKQQQSTNDAHAIAESISEKMEDINKTFEVVSSESNDTLNRAKTGNTVIHNTVEQMKFITSKTQATSSIINQLGKKSNEIEHIVALITDVSEQTNLLALNAAIEAARAGEHGKGFAVVANEVRKLAEQTGSAAGNISLLIQTIKEDIEGSVASMGESNSAVERGKNMVVEAGDAFASITEAVGNVSNRIDEVKSLVNQVKHETETLTVSIEETRKIGEEATSYSQMVAESAEEQNASIEEIIAASETLAEIAEELQQEIATFKV